MFQVLSFLLVRERRLPQVPELLQAANQIGVIEGVLNSRIKIIFFLKKRSFVFYSDFLPGQTR